MSAPEKNLFAVLGLDGGAEERQIRGAYRRLAKKLHPDLNPNNPLAGEQFKEVAHAYWVLSDPIRKQVYLEANPHLYKEVFKTRGDDAPFGAGSAVQAPKDVPEAGKDILVRLRLSLEELAEGAIKKVKIRRWQRCLVCEGTGIAGGARSEICPGCRGKGEVPDFISGGSMPCRKCGGTGVRALSACSSCAGRGQVLEDVSITVGVPPGSDDQEKIVVKGHGHEGYLGGKSGDLRVIIKQKDHPYLARRGSDLYYHCTITLSQWLNGCELQVPTLNSPVALRIAANAVPEGALKIRGRGIPRKDGGRGDLIVKYSLCTPKKLSRKQLSLLKRLEMSDGFSPRLDEQGFSRREVEDKTTN